MSDKFGIAQTMIYPIQNYSRETECNLGINILALRTLRQILRTSKTFLKDMMANKEEEMKLIESKLGNE